MKVLEPRPRSRFPLLETSNILLICLPSTRVIRVTENATTSQNRSLDWTLENVIFLSLTVILENMKCWYLFSCRIAISAMFKLTISDGGLSQ